MGIWRALIRKLPIGFSRSSNLMAPGWMVALVGLGIWRFRVVSGVPEFGLWCADRIS